MITEGDLVPKFEINDANGNSIKSSNFKGKKHVIYFYPKDFTPGCTTEADEFSKDYKKFQKEGKINAGVYLLNKKDFLKLNFQQKFSFEKDFMEQYYSRFNMHGFSFDNYFIDIGIPEDYHQAQQDFKTMFPQ